ncbi:MAG: hypothetical protein GY906_19035 [bacterium]|nr:hypothetical protein [bacterium]
MDTPSGRASVRMSYSEDHFRPHSTLLQVAMALFLGLVAFGGVRSWAGDDEVPEQAVMAQLSSRSLILDAVSTDGGLVAVGERGHILKSIDGGASWQQATVPTRATLTGVHFHDADLGWVVGHDSVILRTTDGGASWERVHWAPEDEEPFLDVWFSDAENGVAIGAYGSYDTTADGGTTWAYQLVDEDGWHLHKIARAEDGCLYIAAEAGLVYRSDDDGTTWQKLPSPYEGSYFGVLPLEDNVVLLYGLRGHLFRSEDGGESWREIETGTVAMLTDSIRLSDGRIVLCGLGGTLLVSSDGGRNFELLQQSSRRGISAIVESPDGTLLMVGEFGVRTTAANEINPVSD